MNKAIGHMGWLDLTVEDAPGLRDFYKQVIGWGSEAVSMGDYEDYTMVAPDGARLAGVCHARGSNAGLPVAWMIYINVADLDESMSHCRELGGEVVSGPRQTPGYGRYCIIRDPAGVACALFEHESSDA